MRKILFLLSALLGTAGAWATVTQPTLTSDESNPTYYVIQNARSGKYANFVGASAQLTQVASASAGVNALWYFMTNGDGVSIVPAADPTVKLASTSSATAAGSVWYTPENPYNAGTFCVSLTSGATANCWDDQGGHTTIGYWQPAANDYQGTSWNIVEVPVTKEQVDAGTVNMEFALTKLDVLARLTPLSSLSVYTDGNVTAVRNATNETEMNNALKAFETSISLYCRSSKYLVVGESACSYVASPSGYEEAIMLESAGNGTFYLKGYKSEKYVGDVVISQAISTTSTPTTAFYFQTYNGYTVLRPSDTSSSYDGYRYIHNGGSGCVGWTADGTNTQHTIAEVTLPAAMVNVTYHLMVGGVDKAQATVECGVGDAPAAPAALQYDFTTYTYDVTEITASTTDVYATPIFNMPFTVSADYDNATWYYLNGHATYSDRYISTNGTDINCSAGLSRTDAYKWAFIGNPIDGIKVINKASGDGNYINATDPATMGTTAKAWTLKQQTTTSWNSGTRGFGLYDSSLTYLNCRPGTPGSIKYWSSFDQGSTFWVVDVATSDKNALGEAITTAQALVVAPGVPGYPTIEAAATLSDAITAAQGVYEDTDGDYVTAYSTLTTAINTAKANIGYTPRTDVYYTITSARGSMVYDASHDASVDSDGNNFLWYTTSLDNTNVNHLWGFIEQDGKYYMYNVGKKQFATVSTSGSYQVNDKGTWVFSDTPAYVTFDAGINSSVAAPYVRVRATVATTETTYSMSISTGYTGPVITYDAQGDGGIPMLLAMSSVGVDDAITAEMTEKVEDVTPYRQALETLIAACAQINIGSGVNQYAETSDYTAALAAANTVDADEDATKSELQTVTVNLEEAISGLTLNLPTAGFYRIKGLTSGNYLASGKANDKYAMSDATDASTIFYFDGNTLVNYGSGLSNGVSSGSWDWVYTENASTVEFSDGQTGGGYVIKSATVYFYDGGENADRGSSLGSNARYRSWYLEEVTSLPVAISAVGYATLYAPVALKVPAGVTAFTGTILTLNAKNYLHMERLDAEAIPAGLAVVLKGSEGTYDFEVTTAPDMNIANDLRGTIGGMADATDKYILAQLAGEEKPGFYRAERTNDNDEVVACPLAGFKAYLEVSGNSYVNGFTFFFEDEDATGINAVEGLMVNGQPIYNLAGQRIQKMQKGINIVNGKKVLF